MRVAIANRMVAGVTGATTLILEHARRMASIGWDVDVYAESIDAARVRSCEATPRRLLAWPWGSYLKRRMFAWQAGRRLRAGHFDLIFGHGDTLDQDILYLHNCVHAAHEAVRGGPLPPDSGVGRMHARILGERRFRRIVANSKLMADDLRARYSIQDGLIAVVYPGFDPARFSPGDRQSRGRAVRDRLGVKPGERLVGLVTSGDFKKRGVDIFLEALGRLSVEQKQGLHALIVGQETRLEPYRQAAADAGLGERAHFLPPEPDVAPFFHALDVYVFPCRWEEFGMSALEAMACGLPVVTTRRTGVSELLTGEARDTLADHPEPAALAGSLEALLRSPEKRMRWGSEASAAGLASTWDIHWKGFLSICERVLDEKGMARRHQNSI